MTRRNHDSHASDASGAHAHDKTDSEASPVEQTGVRSEACCAVPEVLAWVSVRRVNLNDLINCTFQFWIGFCHFYKVLILIFIVKISLKH